MSCLLAPSVTGYSRVPDPPARMMPFVTETGSSQLLQEDQDRDRARQKSCEGAGHGDPICAPNRVLHGYEHLGPRAGLGIARQEQGAPAAPHLAVGVAHTQPSLVRLIVEP